MAFGGRTVRVGHIDRYLPEPSFFDPFGVGQGRYRWERRCVSSFVTVTVVDVIAPSLMVVRWQHGEPASIRVSTIAVQSGRSLDRLRRRIERLPARTFWLPEQEGLLPTGFLPNLNTKTLDFWLVSFRHVFCG